jgi:GNAT superfamily N-acetyltransferase
MADIDFAPLDNPIWFSLTSGHQSLARSAGLARRYPSDVSPLSALAEPTPRAFADMTALVGPDESAGLFTIQPIDVPADWNVARTRWIEQMVCTKLATTPSITPLALGPSDVPDMLALTAVTEPGPFLPQTIRMGRYFGIRSPDGRLAAMAGERLRPGIFTEVSAVCTHPDFRGRGYGRELVSFVAGLIIGEKRVPFLHVKTENSAVELYKKVGFSVRRSICVTLVTRK